ncbi:MAG TPA: SxtJ family membrane protein [Chryseosolibacter sp.]|nr:SxtJ family membrane protein [Chryseosolibacter sp.]
MQTNDRFKTILVIVTGLLTLAWIFYSPLLAKIGLAVAVISLIFPAAAKWIEWAWIKVATGLGWLNSRVILSVVYFVCLMPIAWISRMFTRDPLELKRARRSTLYVTRDHLYTKKDLENIW